MKKILTLLLLFQFIYFSTTFAQPIFDDKLMLDGYAEKFKDESQEILLAIILDETVTSYKTASAVRIFREKYSEKIFSKEKNIIEKTLLRRLSRTDSSFVEVEIMHTLLSMDRYRFFASLIPALIRKLDHYNSAVNEIAYKALDETIKEGSNRSREARIVFNTLRKILFLSRKTLEKVKEPDERLKQKLELVRWSVKILGTEELKRLPKEAINLL